MNHYVCRLPVRFQEVDAAGIVFFSRILEYHHDAYEGWMRSIGFPLDPTAKDHHHVLPLAHAEADYHAPILLGQDLEVRLRVAAVGTTSFTMASWIGTPTGEDLATVRTVHVCVDRGSHRPAHLPDSFRETLLRHFKPEES